MELLGIADVDPDNYVDLCVGISGRVPNKLYVNMKCGAACFSTHEATAVAMDESSAANTTVSTTEVVDEADIVFGPAGNACTTQIVVVKSKYSKKQKKSHKSKGL